MANVLELLIELMANGLELRSVALLLRSMYGFIFFGFMFSSNRPMDCTLAP